MPKSANAQIIAMLLTAVLFGRAVQLRPPFASRGRSKEAVAQSQTPQ